MLKTLKRRDTTSTWEEHDEIETAFNYQFVNIISRAIVSAAFDQHHRNEGDTFYRPLDAE